MHVTTLNAKGLNVPEKRNMLLNDLKRTCTDVAFVQETHFKAGGLPFLQNIFFSLCISCFIYQAKSKGVSILISSRISWSLTEKRLDLNGHYLFLKGYLGGIKVTLATVYSPNLHQDSFLSKVLSKLAEFVDGKLILGGTLISPWTLK